MALKDFKQFQAQSDELNQVQKNVADYSSQIKTNPLLTGILVQNVALSTVAKKVQHKLGRAPVGYLIVSKSAPANVSDSIATESKPELYLTLTATANCTVTLWVF